MFWVGYHDLTWQRQNEEIQGKTGLNTSNSRVAYLDSRAILLRSLCFSIFQTITLGLVITLQRQESKQSQGKVNVNTYKILLLYVCAKYKKLCIKKQFTTFRNIIVCRYLLLNKFSMMSDSSFLTKCDCHKTIHALNSYQSTNDFK